MHQKIRKCSVHSGKEAQKGPAWQGIILQELDGALRYVKIISLRINEKHLQAMILRPAEHFRQNINLLKNVKKRSRMTQE